jgi:thymidylate synthase ThyX
MKVIQVAVRPTEASNAAGRPALTPELLAASGARYSRNNEGLEAILAQIDPANLDKSVDSIFRMLDYGHQSIADMAPVAMFMDGLSLWLAYHVWTLAPTAGGQESSTRYIHYGADEIADAAALGIPEALRAEWENAQRAGYRAYAEALELWQGVAEAHPAALRLPPSLLEDGSERAQKQVARMRRNYGFDRARNFLPVAAATNVMLIMSARAWSILCRHLASHPLPEPQRLAELIRAELGLAAPRMTKHTHAAASTRRGIERELDAWSTLAAAAAPENLQRGAASYAHPATPFLEVFPPSGATPSTLAGDLESHENRYAWIGSTLCRTSVRFGWEAVGFAEIRDLNRHRTGTKWCPLAPVGFYVALDQLPDGVAGQRLRALSEVGRNAALRARELLAQGEATAVYWNLLGTQFRFEHTTTADKFLYEAELRTGAGAHFRYAGHLRAALALWYEKFPQTRGLVLEGSAEPE